MKNSNNNKKQRIYPLEKKNKILLQAMESGSWQEIISRL